MDKQKLFELAVSLTSANIKAGQFLDARNFSTVVYDQTIEAYIRLEEAWKDIASGSIYGEGAAPTDESGTAH